MNVYGSIRPIRHEQPAAVAVRGSRAFGERRELESVLGGISRCAVEHLEKGPASLRVWSESEWKSMAACLVYRQ